MSSSINPNQTITTGEAPKEILSFADSPSIQNEPAGFWIRAVATIVDGLFMSLLTLPLQIGLQFAMAGIKENPMLALVATGVNYIVYFAVMVWFYTKKGGLPGKLIFGLRVVDSKTGANMKVGQVFMRELLGKILSALLLFGGFIMAAFHSEKKALHDIIAGTQVIKKNKGVSG